MVSFKSTIFGWSHHNYKDVANRMPLSPATNANPSTGNRAQLVRKILTGTWGGYPSTSVNHPLIYLTEGGYHRPNGTPNSASQDTIQKSDLARAISRLKNDTSAGEPGNGIEMFTNFLFYTDMYLGVGYDSGLCRPAPLVPPYPTSFGSYERPAYGTWKTSF